MRRRCPKMRLGFLTTDVTDFLMSDDLRLKIWNHGALASHVAFAVHGP